MVFKDAVSVVGCIYFRMRRWDGHEGEVVTSLKAVGCSLANLSDAVGVTDEVNCSGCWCVGHRVAVKILDNVADNIEEIEEEYLVLRDLSMHPNIPSFHGLYLRPGQTQEEDQLWFIMEVRIFLLVSSDFSCSKLMAFKLRFL
jgi:serine/threonine protein kinase